VVSGAAPVHNTALASIGSEMSFASGMAFLLKFDIELANHSKTYAGSATLSYRW